jgi:hypothetical protein
MRWVNYFEHKWVSFGECQRVPPIRLKFQG